MSRDKKAEDLAVAVALEDELLAARRPVGVVVAHLVRVGRGPGVLCELPGDVGGSFGGCLHHVDLPVTVAVAGEDDQLTVRADSGQHVAGRVRGEPLFPGRVAVLVESQNPDVGAGEVDLVPAEGALRVVREPVGLHVVHRVGGWRVAGEPVFVVAGGVLREPGRAEAVGGHPPDVRVALVVAGLRDGAGGTGEGRLSVPRRRGRHQQARGQGRRGHDEPGDEAPLALARPRRLAERDLRHLSAALSAARLAAPAVEGPHEGLGYRVALCIRHPCGDGNPKLSPGRERLLRGALGGAVRIENRRRVVVGHFHGRGDRHPPSLLRVVYLQLEGLRDVGGQVRDRGGRHLLREAGGDVGGARHAGRPLGRYQAVGEDRGGVVDGPGALLRRGVHVGRPVPGPYLEGVGAVLEVGVALRGGAGGKGIARRARTGEAALEGGRGVARGELEDGVVVLRRGAGSWAHVRVKRGVRRDGVYGPGTAAGARVADGVRSPDGEGVRTVGEPGERLRGATAGEHSPVEAALEAREVRRGGGEAEARRRVIGGTGRAGGYVGGRGRLVYGPRPAGREGGTVGPVHGPHLEGVGSVRVRVEGDPGGARLEGGLDGGEHPALEAPEGGVRGGVKGERHGPVRARRRRARDRGLRGVLLVGEDYPRLHVVDGPELAGGRA